MKLRILKRRYERLDPNISIVFGGENATITEYEETLQYKDDKGEWVDVPVVVVEEEE